MTISRYPCAPIAYITAACLAVILPQPLAMATDYSWTTGDNGQFLDSSSWTPSGYPNDNEDMAIFDVSGEYVVIFNVPSYATAITNKRIEVGAGVVQLKLINQLTSPDTAATYILDPPGSLLTTAATIGMHSGTAAQLVVTGGADGLVNADGAVFVGFATGSTGRLDIGDPNFWGLGSGNWTSDYSTWIGFNGTGTLYLNSGSLTDGGAIIGSNANATGLAFLKINGDWTNNGVLSVGQYGHGYLTIGGDLITNNAAYIARFAGSTGSVEATGGSWDIGGRLYCGGTATTAGGTGSLAVTGMCFIDAFLGLHIWPDGEVSIESGAIRSHGYITTDAGAELNLAGGTLQIDADELVPEPGTFNWTSGTLHITDNLNVDTDEPLGDNCTIGSNKTLAVDDAIIVGSSESGQLNVYGGTVTSSSAQIGSQYLGTGASASVLSGNGASWTINNDLTVRGLVEADLLVKGQAVLTNDNAFIASHTGSKADIDVEDFGTLWSNTGSLYLGGNAAAAVGIGTLDVSNQARVDVLNTMKVWDRFVVTLNQGTISATDAYVTGQINGQGADVLLLQSGSLQIDGGSVALAGTGMVDLISGYLEINDGGVLIADVYGNDDTNVVMATTDSTWTMPGHMQIGVSEEGPGNIGSLSLGSGVTVNIGGTLTVNDIFDFELNGATINALSTDLIDADFEDFGTINGDFFTTGSVTATGPLTLGDENSFSGVEIGGPVTVGAQHVTLKKKGFFTLSNSTSIDGGVLDVPGGAALPAGNSLVAAGTINGRIAAQLGSTIAAAGPLTLGDATSPVGFFTDGELLIDDQIVTINDSNEAILGTLTWIGLNDTPGALVASNGLIIDLANAVVGYGLIDSKNGFDSPVVNNGYILGDSPTQQIEIAGYLTGTGSLDYVTITGTDDPGDFGPDYVFRGSTTYAGQLRIEIGGHVPGLDYDRIDHDGHSAFGGELVIDVLEGFEPQLGDSFTIMTYGSYDGRFDTITAPGTCFGNTFRVDYGPNELTVTVTDWLPGDVNLDGQVTLADYTIFASCLTGPAVATAPECPCTDLDQNGTTDLVDFGVVQSHFNSGN